MGSGWSGGWLPQSGVGGGDEDYYTERRIITGLEAANRYLVLTSVPQPPEQVSVAFVKGTEQCYGTDFVMTSDDGNRRLSWDGLGMQSIVEPGDCVLVRYPIVS